MQEETSAKREVTTPPYISFRTLLNLIERMGDEGVPPRIDRSYLSGLSGGYQTQVMAALRWLGLIDSEGRVQDRLIELVEQPARRRDLIGTLIADRYPHVVALGQVNATQGQLEDEFRKSNIGGATLRKAVSFYLHAADFGGIELSPFFKTPTVQEGRTPSRRRKPRTTKPVAATSEEAPEKPTPTSANGTTEALRVRYIEMLMAKVDAQDAMDSNLLDRIEALLGYQQESPGEPSTGKTSE